MLARIVDDHRDRSFIKFATVMGEQIVKGELAEAIDLARNPARGLMDQVERLLGDGRFAAETRDTQPMADVVAGFGAVETFEVKTQADALVDLR